MRLGTACLLALFLAPVALAQGPSSYTLTTPDGDREVYVSRDGYGVPLIESYEERDVFFGQGFAVAQDRLYQMETFWRAATGRLAEVQGPSALAQDQAIRTVYYTPAERAAQYQALSEPVRDMLASYVAGINVYIDSTEANPDVYLPAQYRLSGLAPERWDLDKAVAVMQFFMRRFGEIGGEELARLAELEAQGPAWFEANRPVNDPNAATTLQTPPTVALPPTGTRSVTDYPAGTAAFAAAGAQHVAETRAATAALYTALGVPLQFGSFAATVPFGRSAVGRSMLLGAPQMGTPSATQPSVTSEVVLTTGEFILAGMTVPGIPGVIIGRKDTGFIGGSWTLTTGYTDNTDTYLEQLDASGQQYLFDGEMRPFEVITEQIGVAGGAPVSFSHLRSVHGPVYFRDTDAGLAATWKYAFWNRELDMVEALHALWTGTEEYPDVETSVGAVPMSFNFFWQSHYDETAYWHLGRYPERPADADPRLPLMGTGEDGWVGILPFTSHLSAFRPTEILVNWNNKPAPWWPQGDNVSWTANPPSGYARTFDGVTFLQNHLAASGAVSVQELQELTRVVRSNGTYNEYPGTYQQVVVGAPCSWGPSLTVSPPGQSAFLGVVDGQPVPGPHTSDQLALYQSSAGSGDIQMKESFLPIACPSVEPEAESGARLLPPAPNPAAGTARLSIELDAPATVRLSVIDALGREVAVLADGQRPAGPWTTSLDTRALAPGVYVVRLSAGDRVASQRLVVTR